MKISQRLLTSAAALGLVISALTAAAPAPIASAAPPPDVAVTVSGYTYGANGNVDVTFGLTNKDMIANVTLNTTCNYRTLSGDKHTRSDDNIYKIGLSATQSVPLPKVVTCAPQSNEYVSTVSATANVYNGDSDPSNNTAVWDHTKLPKPDVNVAMLNRVYLRSNTAAKVLFAMNNNTATDAPIVNLHTKCEYKTAVNAKGVTTEQDLTIAVPHGGDFVPQWVNCIEVPGQHVTFISLVASVPLPYVESNLGNNMKYWDITTNP